MRTSTKRAFDEQIARMKQNEEADGLWCVCGHSSPTHDVGFTCQSVACDCLNFRPSKAAHTPTPWEVGGGPYDEELKTYPPIITSECRDVAKLETYYGDAEANAEFIVKAVNSHDALIAALQATFDAIEGDSRYYELFCKVSAALVEAGQ